MLRVASRDIVFPFIIGALRCTDIRSHRDESIDLPCKRPGRFFL